MTGVGWVLSLALVLSVQSVYCDSSPVRQTTNGPVEGIELQSSLGQKYYAFKGIPFAELPITGTDPYTGEQIDRRFKVHFVVMSFDSLHDRKTNPFHLYSNLTKTLESIREKNRIFAISSRS